MSKAAQPRQLWEPEEAERVGQCLGKINLEPEAQPNFAGEHRSGWSYALNALWPLHAAGGVLLDSFLERTFSWHEIEESAEGRIPYTRPWIGFFHNPPGIPHWHDYSSSPQAILARPSFQQSIPQCRGLFALSDHLGDWLWRQTSVSVCVLRHPTEVPRLTFDVDAFLASRNRCLVQVGWWLRWFGSIYRLRTPALRKIMIVVRNSGFRDSIARERYRFGIAESDIESVEEMPFLSNGQYDVLLSRSVVFCHLIDSSANNTVIECMARNTPIAVNPLPAVVEYLGEDYPLYFESLEEAEEKLNDVVNVCSAHEYLRSMPKDNLGQKHFRDSLTNSAVYRELPWPDWSEPAALSL